jgi:hypothetical protein
VVGHLRNVLVYRGTPAAPFRESPLIKSRIRRAKPNACLKIQMLTPKGEHSIPCSTRVMFDGRISFDGIATAKTL